MGIVVDPDGIAFFVGEFFLGGGLGVFGDQGDGFSIG